MKMFLYLVLPLALLTSCVSESIPDSKYRDEDPKSLIGRWVIIKEVYEHQITFDLEEKSNKDKTKSANDNFLEFNKKGKVTASIWTSNNTISAGTDTGIYELDDPTGRIRIEIRHNEQSNFHSGSFRWKIKRNHLYLYPTNQKSGTYKVYRRSL